MKFFPRWLAPNVISMMSFVAVIIPLLFVIYDDLMYPEDLPTKELGFLAAIGFIGHLWLDYMDGMQARATGSSSVLGKLIDHGLDKFTHAFFTII